MICVWAGAVAGGAAGASEEAKVAELCAWMLARCGLDAAAAGRYAAALVGDGVDQVPPRHWPGRTLSPTRTLTLTPTFALAPTVTPT